MTKRSYVYVYYLDDKIIYVGIGTEAGHLYSRANQLSLHPEVLRKYRERRYDIEIRVVSENLKRSTALAVEGLLIRTLLPLKTLENINLGAKSELLGADLQKTKSVNHGYYVKAGTNKLLKTSGCLLYKKQLLEGEYTQEDFPKLTDRRLSRLIGALADLRNEPAEGYALLDYQRTDPSLKREAGRKGGENKRKYSPALAKLVQKAQIAMRQAKTEKTREKWKLEIEKLQKGVRGEF